jgi:hypothetical protein
MQLQSDKHVEAFRSYGEVVKEGERRLDEDGKRFFKLFSESTLEGSQAAAQTMKTIAAQQNKNNQEMWLSHSLILLVHLKSSKMLVWPNSPLLVLLDIAGPHVMWGFPRSTLLQLLARLAAPRDYSTHENQVTLGRQIIEHGASVDLVTSANDKTPLHFACHSGVVTNLAFIQLLLENGADPNAKGQHGKTPFLRTMLYSPAVAKFLLEWHSTDANVTTDKGVSFLAGVRLTVNSDPVARFPSSDHPEVVKVRFALQQWREIEAILVEKGAVDTML